MFIVQRNSSADANAIGALLNVHSLTVLLAILI